LEAAEGEGSGYSTLDVLARLARLLAERPLLLASSAALVVAMALLTSYVPVLVRYTIDYGVAAGAPRRAAYYGGLILALTGLSGAASFAGRYLQARLAQETVLNLRLEAFRALLRMPLAYYDRTLTGQLISRVTNDAERVTGFLGFRLRMLVYSLTLIASSAALMWRMSWRLSLVALAGVLATVAANALYARRVRPLYDRVRHQTGVLASIAAGALAGVKTVKGLALEPAVLERFNDANRRYYSLYLAAARLTSIYGNMSFLIMAFAMAGILYLGGELAASGAITVGVLAAFLTYMLTLMWPLNALGFIIGDMQRAVAAARRLFEIIDSAPRRGEPPGAVRLERVRGEVSLEDVWFEYEPGKPVLRGVSLHVRPGERLLIVGPPGSGKSTLLRLIAGLYEPTRGRVAIDGVDVRRLSRDTLRRAVAYVPQEPFIFNRSILENILVGNPHASMEQVRRAAEAARIREFIESLPDGYNTIVGERGVTLSGGQRQRLALARALVGDPRIVLLDDPASNLDAETEARLVDDLSQALRGRTVIVVSQRPSLARMADRVVVMVEGRIVEEGRPGELLSADTLFRRLYHGVPSGGGAVEPRAA